MGQISWHRLN